METPAPATALVEKNQQQEAAKTALRILTEQVEPMRDDTERVASNACDAVIAAFGRTSQQGREAIKLRTSIRNSPRKPEDENPPAAPSP